MSDHRSLTAGAAFPITAWTKVMQVQRGDTDARQVLEELCKGYWPAIYTYLRALGCDREEALDETQEFLARFINGGGLESVSPERGRLRSYLRQAVRNQLATTRRDAARQKRGGGVVIVSMDDAEAFDVPSEPERADHWFDRRWAWSVMRRAMEKLEGRYSERGRGALFMELKAGLISPDLLKPYAEIGASLSMNESQVKLEVHRARRRLADELREEVAGTMEPGANVEEELRYLLTVLSCE
ncbi:MAG: sigma-70 family RNA polymerase sigma factor [Verrucomicrobia bacterium]|nr:sigma-70 family RNA polymerase sigma factor [Verrucomicrobiota bacterium]